MSRIGAARRAAVSVSNARVAASRKNGVKSPTTAAGKTRSAQTALKHGIGGQEYIVLPEEDTAEFAALEAALLAELAPVGALQSVLARRVAIAAWRLARADRIEAELFEERRFADGRLGLALIRDGNGTRSFETLLRYRGAGDGRVLARAQDAQGAPRRAGRQHRPRFGGAPPGGAPQGARGKATARPACRAGRTRARQRRVPTGIRCA